MLEIIFSLRFVTALAAGILGYFIFRRNPRLDYYLGQFPGPPLYPIVGNGFGIMLARRDQYLPLITYWLEIYGSVLRLWLGCFVPYICVADPVVAEKFLSTTNHLEKGHNEYGLLHPWLGFGLLTAPPKKWSTRRKLLTPSFHFKILDDFMPIFNEQAAIFVNCLRNDGVDTGNTIDLYPYVSRCTLVICETAMGKKINAQTNIHADYVNAVEGMLDVLMTKHFTIYYHIPIIYNMSSVSRREAKYLQILQGFTNKVIQDRKKERKRTKSENERESVHDGNSFYGKERKAFLDLLLDVSEDGKVLSDEDIREEVDTFMFEGHDTTASNVAFTILEIAAHPEVQRLVQKELDEIFADDPHRDVTVADVAKMKYLECCLKEGLRLHSTVIAIFRQVEKDVELDDGRIIPQGATAAIGLYFIHRNPKYFPDPLLFKPERFTLENSVDRHPYAFIPFSAGPRNCIGQKFAQMEEKVILAKLFREFCVTAVDKEKVVELPNVILRTFDGMPVKIHKRK